MMNLVNRRKFLQSTAGLLGALMTTGFNGKQEMPKLSFSTLGCPDWSFKEILDFAVAHEYSGIEIRGIQRQMDLTKCPEFSSPSSIKESNRVIAGMGLKIVNLGSSTALHHEAPADRLKHLDEAKRFIDLAVQLNCPYVRVFPDKIPKEKDHDTVLELIAAGLVELGDYANKTSVTVLMETHGDVVSVADILKVMQLTYLEKVGLVWDILNMWEITKEPPAMVYEAIKKHIRHTHIKDARIVDGNLRYTMIGEGESPILQAVDILRNAGYDGYYSFEWEKFWHPEIEEPEIALAHYAKTMKAHFRQ